MPGSREGRESAAVCLRAAVTDSGAFAADGILGRALLDQGPKSGSSPTRARAGVRRVAPG
jgi:hypothetical protein